MDIILTQWALDTYLELVRSRVFDAQEYKMQIRPDVLLLRDYPNDSKFGVQKFWSPAGSIPGGFKMKWHQVGSGNVQLRLGVGVWSDAILCEGYVKRGAKAEARKLARLKTHMQLVVKGRYTKCGKIK